MKYALILFSLLVVIVSCETTQKGPGLTTEEQFELDLGLIDAYLTQNSIEAQIDASGIRYVIHEAGTGDQPFGTSTITINYEGRFLNTEEVFDAGEGFRSPLNAFIEGWRIGIPLIKEGGRITLYLPSGYAYGEDGTTGIGPNENLIFDVDLVEVSN